MSFPHQSAASIAAVHRTSFNRPVTPAPEIRPQRRPAITRRYEVSWLDKYGEVQGSTRLAPASVPFEEAFSAFARGTLIATDQGQTAVEDLVPGMRIITAEGRIEPLVWIGSMIVYPARAVPEIAPVTMTRITGDAFGEGRPMPDLLLGPQARILFRDPRCRGVCGTDTSYAPARAFVDGDHVISVSPVAPMAVFHLMLRRQGTIRAAGVDVESYHPGLGYGEVIDPQMAGLFLSLFPQVAGFADFGPVAHPRLTLSDAEMILGN